MSSASPTSEQDSHSDPIPINSPTPHRSRPRSGSETSDDSVPSLSPSQSPASTASVNVQTPLSSSSRVPLSPVSPSSPILSYFYGSPTKSAFARAAPPSTMVEGQPCPFPENERLIFRPADEESQEPSPAPASPHSRRMSSSWIPVRFAQPQQNTPAVEGQQDRGAGLLRRLSISNPLTSKPPVSSRSTTPSKQDGGTRGSPNPSPRASGQLRKAATLSAGTVDANSKPRAPSPMGERMLKGHYDGF